MACWKAVGCNFELGLALGVVAGEHTAGKQYGKYNGGECFHGCGVAGRCQIIRTVRLRYLGIAASIAKRTLPATALR